VEDEVALAWIDANIPEDTVLLSTQLIGCNLIRLARIEDIGYHTSQEDKLQPGQCFRCLASKAISS